MKKARLCTATLLLLLPSALPADTEAEKAREKLAKDGVLFTVDSFLGAAGGGERKRVELFLKAGMAINSRNERGETALLRAAESDDPEMAAYLLRAGADVDGRSHDGDTALRRSVRNGRDGGGRLVTAVLLAAKADVKLRYDSGETLLHAAASSRRPEAIKTLIAAGAEVDARNEKGETALYQCACTGQANEMAVFIAAGADVNARDANEQTALMSAALCGEAQVVSLLLYAKADPKAQDRNGQTALVFVAQTSMHFVETGGVSKQSLTKIVQELIAAGGDPNVHRKHDGSTPLITASKQGNLAVVQALLEGGANVNGHDRYGKTALQEAQDKPEVVAMLKAAVSRAPLQAAGPSAQGQLTVDGKTITLSYAYAVSGPDSFDGTKEAFMVLLTEKPLAAGAIKEADSFDELGGKSARSLVQSGLAVKIGPDKGYHVTIRHPALKERELQKSAFSGLQIVTLGPDRVAGTFASSSGMGKSEGDAGPEEIVPGRVAQFKIRFDATVERRFPLEEKLELAANARKLPAGGGEPGKAWLDQECKPLPALPNLKDSKAVEKYLFAQGMTEKDLEQEMARMSKLKGHPVNREEVIKTMAEMMAGMADLGSAIKPSDCKVLGGADDGRVAIIQVEVTMGGGRVRTDITLVKVANAWTVKKTGAWRSAQ